MLSKTGFSPVGPVWYAKELHMHQTYVHMHAEHSGQKLHSSGVSVISYILLMYSAQ